MKTTINLTLTNFSELSQKYLTFKLSLCSLIDNCNEIKV